MDAIIYQKILFPMKKIDFLAQKIEILKNVKMDLTPKGLILFQCNPSGINLLQRYEEY